MKLDKYIMLPLLLFLFPICIEGQEGEGRLRVLVPGREVSTPSWGIKSNLLYDATGSISLGAEFGISSDASLEIPLSYNPWSFGGGRKWKHILVQPEIRRWLDGVFSGHFLGLHGHYAYYNVGRLPHPPFTQHMSEHRFEGHLGGAGVSYGYRYNFGSGIALEGTLGVGYAFLSYDKYLCGTCGEQLGHRNRHYIGPTKAAISVIYSFGAAPVARPAVYVTPDPVKPYEPRLEVSFVTPQAEVKVRSERVSAYLDFIVARAEILPGFRNNAEELKKIHRLIEAVGKDPDITVTGMYITGYASPEGNWLYNQSLSERRMQALGNHLRGIHRFDPGAVMSHGAGEDWETLDRLVEESFLPDKYTLLEIIRSVGDPDERDRRLQMVGGGMSYRQIREEIFPRLRRVDYRIEYTVAPFSLEKGKEVLKSKPGSLSLNELFLIARTYEAGSEEFNRLFEIAARLYPQSDEANVNASANALERGEVLRAARYLDKVQERTVAYWNNLGIISYRQGDIVKALRCFAKGGALGAGNAQEVRRGYKTTEKKKVNRSYAPRTEYERETKTYRDRLSAF